MKARLLFTVVALQCLWVLATVAVQEYNLGHATVVRLATRPVDPRDLLRGDYVTLNYEISRLPAVLFGGALTQPVESGTPVYVKLVRKGDVFVAEAASFQPLEADAAHPVLRGTASNAWAWLDRDGVGSLADRVPSVVRVEFGLEQYFVREGTGQPRGKMTVDVAVPASGRGLIREVYLDGEPYAMAMEGIGR